MMVVPKEININFNPCGENPPLALFEYYVDALHDLIQLRNKS